MSAADVVGAFAVGGLVGAIIALTWAVTIIRECSWPEAIRLVWKELWT